MQYNKMEEKILGLKNHLTTRHIKYNRVDLAPCNKSIIANKLLSTNLEQFLRRVKSPLTR